MVGMMDSIEVMSADFAQEIADHTLSGDGADALRVKIEWAAWRDSLSLDEKERCVEAFTAAQVPLSDAALELLKMSNPIAYNVYQGLKGI